MDRHILGSRGIGFQRLGEVGQCGLILQASVLSEIEFIEERDTAQTQPDGQ
ncbi:MAG: hypothetical protein JSR62_04140 [Nitrospira sp.]|nr:hypothetical protein [Nitrospira sp.]